MSTDLMIAVLLAALLVLGLALRVWANTNRIVAERRKAQRRRRVRLSDQEVARRFAEIVAGEAAQQ